MVTLVVEIGGKAESDAGGQQHDGGGCAARLHLHQLRLLDAGVLWGQGASEDHLAVRSTNKNGLSRARCSHF